MENNKVMRSFMKVMDKISGPMAAFGNFKVIQAIQNGLVASVGITIIGAVFLLLFVFSTPDYLAKGLTVLPFLSGISTQFLVVNALTMSLLALYVAVSIAIEFGKQYGIEPVSSALSGLLAFIILSNNGTQTVALVSDITTKSFTKGVFNGSTFTALNVSNYGGGGLILAMIAGLGAIAIINFCYKHNIRIKLPDSVPPAIGNSFSSLIPYALIAFICWGIRTLMNFDLASWLTTVLLPVLGAADNVFSYTFCNFLKACLWSVGLHGDNMLSGIITPITTIWLNSNVAAATAGKAIPHVWIANVCRLDQWVSSVWPILVYLLTSKKLRHMRPFALACTPAAIFGIIEPVMYGLPIVLNPYFFIPMIISHTITSITTYMPMALGWVNRPYINTPWCLPAPFIAVLQSGMDIRGLLIVVVNFCIGMIIFYPFFKSYEKVEVAKMEAEASNAQA